MRPKCVTRPGVRVRACVCACVRVCVCAMSRLPSTHRVQRQLMPHLVTHDKCHHVPVALEQVQQALAHVYAPRLRAAGVRVHRPCCRVPPLPT